MTGPRLDAVGLVAADVAATVRFYAALGCPFPDPSDGPPGHVECELDGFRLMVDSEEVMSSFAPDTWSGGGAGRLTLAVRCAAPADVDRLHDEAVPLGRGSLVAPFDAPWGQRYATVLDPDGSRVDLYAPLDGG